MNTSVIGIYIFVFTQRVSNDRHKFHAEQHVRSTKRRYVAAYKRAWQLNAYKLNVPSVCFDTVSLCSIFVVLYNHILVIGHVMDYRLTLVSIRFTACLLCCFLILSPAGPYICRVNLVCKRNVRFVRYYTLAEMAIILVYRERNCFNTISLYSEIISVYDKWDN